MNGRTEQFDPNDEASLLAMVEGLLPVDRARVVREMLANGTPEQKALLRKLDLMKRDRAGVASLEAPMAPLGLVEAAMRRAQQEALAGLRLAGDQAVEIPVSRVVPNRKSWWNGTRRMVAMAAMVGLVGGVGLIALWPASKTNSTLQANRDSTDKSDSKSNENGGTPVRIAIADESATDTTPVTDPVDAGSTAEAPRAPLAIMSAPPADRAERMLELAKAGRLVLRVTPRSPRQCEQQLASLAARPQGSRVWDVSATPPSEVVTALAALTPNPEATSESQRPAEIVPAFASTSERRFPMIIRPPAPLAIVLPPKAEDLVGLARVAPTLDGIEAIRRALTETLGVVTVAELAEPLAGMDAMETTRTIESTLWWSGPPTRWANWASVPVIIER
jgi:hypothetical protein